ncbi:MAG: hypothetical protein R5N65_09750, partial [Cutibacterium granulosum]|uniref:hypothetical protein n=1 Tax=Cutibacterium granulosum TaxID=33011 RepID=UPI002B2280C1
MSIPVLGLQCANPSPRPVIAHMCAQLADVFWCAGKHDAGRRSAGFREIEIGPAGIEPQSCG